MPPARSTKTTRTPAKPRDCSWVLANILSRMGYRNKSDKHTISPNIQQGSPHTSFLRPLHLSTDPVGPPRWPTQTASAFPGYSSSVSSFRLNQQRPADPSPQASSSSRVYPRNYRPSTAHPYSQQYHRPVHFRNSGRPCAQVIALQEDLLKLREETNKEHAHKDSCMARLLAAQLVYSRRLKAEKAARREAERGRVELKEVLQEKNELVAARDAVILGKDKTIAGKDKEIFGKDEMIRRLNGKIEDLKMHLRHMEDEKLLKVKTSYDALCAVQDAFEREKEQFEGEKKRAVEAFYKEKGEFEVEKNKILEERARFVKEIELLQRETAQSKKALEDVRIEARERVRKEFMSRAGEKMEDVEMRSASSSLASIDVPDSFAMTSMGVGAFAPRPAPLDFAPRHTPATPALTFTQTTPALPPQTPANTRPAQTPFNFSVARAVPTWTPDPALAKERAARPVKGLPRRRMRP